MEKFLSFLFLIMGSVTNGMKTLLKLFLFLALILNTASAQIIEPVVSYTYLETGFQGDITTLHQGNVGGTYMSTSNAQNVAGLDGSQFGVNAGDYTPIGDIYTLSDGSRYMMAINSLGNKVLVQCMSPMGQWIELPLPNGITPNMSPVPGFSFGIFSVLDKAGFYFGQGPLAVHSGKIYLFNDQTGEFELKLSFPITFASRLAKVVQVSENQIMYVTEFGSEILGDIVFDVSGNVVTHNQINIRTTNDILITEAYVVEVDIENEKVFLGLRMRYASGNQFLNKLYSYDTDVSVDDSSKLTEVAEFYDFDPYLTAFAVSDNTKIRIGLCMYNSNGSTQYVRFTGSNVTHQLARGLHLISFEDETVTQLSLGEGVTDIIGWASDMYIDDDKIYLSTQPSFNSGIQASIQLMVDGQIEWSDGLVIFDYDAPIVIEPTFYTYYADLDFDTYSSGDTIQDTITLAPLGYLAQMSAEIDCDDSNPNINSGAVEILDNNVDENCDGIKEYTPVDTIGTSISFLHQEDFKIYSNGSEIMISSKTSKTYTYAIMNVLGQIIVQDDFENEVGVFVESKGVLFIKIFGEYNSELLKQILH
jgi:hypothetical protein